MERSGPAAVGDLLRPADDGGGFDDPQDPLLLQYETPYYRETLKRVATDQKNSLRWIKKLPPVK